MYFQPRNLEFQIILNFKVTKVLFTKCRNVHAPLHTLKLQSKWVGKVSRDKIIEKNAKAVVIEAKHFDDF